jgi:hypothetical protein
MASTAISYPLVNGARHSFVSTEVRFTQPAVGSTQTGAALALALRGYKSINYNRTRSRTMVRGNHPDPLGKTRGTNEYKADCEFFLAEFNAIQAALQALAGQGYGDVFFDVVVTYSENGFDTITDTIIGCTLDTTEASNSEGTEATMRKMEFNPLKVLFNGLDDVPNPLQGGAQ